jgi:kynureninase
VNEQDNEQALEMDAADALARFRAAFAIPARDDGQPACYLSGHSLGLMPHTVPELLGRETDRWSKRAVAGHFDADGWFEFHERFSAPLADLLGAEAREVIAMNSLTVNLHLMLASFFRPDGDRRRILIERGAFPSDRFAAASQLKWHGLDPQRDLIELAAEPGQLAADALDAELTRQPGQVALILLPGVQYLSGEALDLAACAAIARRHDCAIGFDLAHAIGNLAIDLRASEPDFAVWCSYKYLNSGPGAIGGCFINRSWLGDDSIGRLEGWWGHDKETRFDTGYEFRPMATAEAWQLSNPPIFAMAPLEASLDLFSQAGIDRLRAKSVALTDFLEARIRTLCGEQIEIMTPARPHARGAQLSLRLSGDASRTAAIVELMRRRGVIVDWRAPNLLRLAPVPLYNRFADANDAANALADALAN